MNKNISTQKNKTIVIQMIFAMFLWGGGWSALKILTSCVSVEVVTLWRFIIMFISFIPILFFYKKPLRLPKNGIKYIFAGSILNILFMFFAYLSVKFSYAGSAGMIITILSPLFTFVLSTVLLKHRYTYIQYFGLFLGMVGIAIMLNVHNIGPMALFGNGKYYLIIAGILWAAVTILSQKSHLHINPIHYGFFISFVSIPILFIITLPFDINIVFKQDFKFWLALLYLGILGQTIAATIFFNASGKIGSAKASSFMFLVPIFALIIGSIVLHEQIKSYIIIGGVISLIAVYFINKKF